MLLPNGIVAVPVVIVGGTAPISAGKWFVIRKIYYFCNYLCIMITRYEPIR